MKLTAYLAASAQTLIAAGTFLVAKDATTYFAPLRLAWFRIVLSGILMLIAYRLFARNRRQPTGRDLGWFALLGLLGVTINQSLFLFGIHLSTPLHASLLYAFTPVVVLFGAVPHLGERLTGGKVLGVIAAVVGVILVLSAKGLDLTRGSLRGDLLILVAVFAWAGYTLVGKKVLSRYDPFTVTTWAFVFGALSVLPFGFWVWWDFDPRGPGTVGWLEVLYLSAITSGAAFTLWYFALQRLEATQLAIFTNLQAPLTALLAWVILDDVPERIAVIGGILVLVGVTTVQIPGRRPLQRRRTGV